MSTLQAVISVERAEIMKQIRDDVNSEAKGFGIDVVDVRLRRADLPEENSEAIYARMQSERQREAAQYRAQGAQPAQHIRADAERERTVIIAEAQRQAQILRGEGDAREHHDLCRRVLARTRISSPSIARCRPIATRLTGQGTTFVVSPDSEFFKYFESGPGRTRAGRRSCSRRPAALKDFMTALALAAAIEGMLYSRLARSDAADERPGRAVAGFGVADRGSRRWPSSASARYGRSRS